MRKHVTYFDSNDAMCEHTAEVIFTCARNAVAEKGVFSIALSGGSTPLPLYRLFSNADFSSRFPWRQSHFFWGDERMVSQDSSRSNFRGAYDAFLGSVPVPDENIHRIKTELPADVAALEYEQELQDFKLKNRLKCNFDFVLLGMGNDGHTASLFPGSGAVDELERQVIAVPAPSGVEPQVPRITLTRSAIASSELVVFMLAGQDKFLLFKSFAEDAGSRYPAALITSRGRVEWFVTQG